MKNRMVAALLAFFLGGFGIHKFYLNNPIGILYILFCWTLIPAIIAFFESIILFMMHDDDFNRRYNTKV
jgi:TM2 domain-containing membrane protein YozV